MFISTLSGEKPETKKVPKSTNSLTLCKQDTVNGTPSVILYGFIIASGKGRVKRRGPVSLEFSFRTGYNNARNGGWPGMKGVLSHEELVSVILPLLRKYGAQEALLFGSYARGEADEESDIDLLVIGGPSFEPTDVFCIADELNRATGKRVDVYELREVNEGSPFYRSIFHEGVKIA